MSAVFSKEGFKVLRVPYGIALAGILVSVFLIGGSHFYVQYERKSNQVAKAELSSTQNKLNAARRERDDLKESEETYRILEGRGVFADEHRLDWNDAMVALKQRHQLLSLSYEVLPQRPLKLLGASAFPAIDVRASRINVKFRAAHDGDLLAFLDEFPRLQQGFFPMDQCTIKHKGELSESNNAVTNTENFSPLNAECSLEWVTLVDKLKTPPRLASK